MTQREVNEGVVRKRYLSAIEKRVKFEIILLAIVLNTAGQARLAVREQITAVNAGDVLGAPYQLIAVAIIGGTVSALNIGPDFPRKL